MKRRIFWSVFLRLQIYKAIAAIFWQSANDVFRHAETGNGAKKQLVLRREIFSL